MANIRTIIAREFADRKTTKPHVLPLYLTSAFAFDNIDEGIDIFKGVAQGHVYSRYANPTIDTVAAKIAALETQGSDLEASCLLLSSGMAAISTVCLALLKPYDKILTQGNLYGGTTELLSKILKTWGVTPVFTDLQGTDWIENQLKTDPSIRMIYGETPANPSMACIDLEKLGSLGRKYGVTTVIDNTFCTPYLQQPLLYGIDLCLHSTTKYLNGHGNSICGAVIGLDKEKMSKVWEAMKLVGTNSNAFDAWLLNNGLKTLALRMDAHCANTKELAGWLESLPEVEKVNYPGLESHPDHVILIVKDNGLGIPPQDMPFIFDRFYRSRRDELSRIEGNGLGLAITRGIVERHGGEINVQSELDQGSTFTVILPRKYNPKKRSAVNESLDGVDDDAQEPNDDPELDADAEGAE